MYKKIGDYGAIGNLRSVALIGTDGSIDWLCLPYLDSPSVFAALLDDERGGRFSISPLDDWESVAEYVHNTNVLTTNFKTTNGAVRVVDFMPVSSNKDEGEWRYELYRIVEGLKGRVPVRMVFEPRLDYVRSKTVIRRMGEGVLVEGEGGPLALSSSGSLEVHGGRATARWDLVEGDRVCFHLQYGTEKVTVIDVKRGDRAREDTIRYWRDWLQNTETGRTVDFGPYRDMVNRSALVLKLLYFHPSGTIAAAATTSLPEEIGGARNWDYRFTWVRDTAFVFQALFELGHLTETEAYLRWIQSVVSEYDVGRLQIMYGLRGEEDLSEMDLAHLAGYKGSRPVRVGNSAAKQRQLDIYGEIMDAAMKLSDYVGKIDFDLWPFLRDICDHVTKHWQDRDSGLWEVRDEPSHFVHSKVMCWVALDRGLTISKRYGFPADCEMWEQAKGKIKEEVLREGWSEKRRSFVQRYGSDRLDASSLLLPLLGFLPVDDPRVVSTVEAVQRELNHREFLYRYTSEDGLPGGEGVFLLCTFWLVCCLVELERLDEAEFLLRKLERLSNHLGLFSEEYDVAWREALGNFPQALSHIGYVNSVTSLINKRKQKEQRPQQQREFSLLDRILGSRIVLNDGKSHEDGSAKEIAFRLKSCMNILRGAFFDTAAGRVAYEQMRDSSTYMEYVKLSCALNHLDLESLGTREERIAFWINLYNVLVIHGVVELGIRDSVKEVRNFFSRIQYRIGDLLFTPDDIEHGILRGNRRPPYALLCRFQKSDPRRAFAIMPIDPRIHFSLVCASSSCPPIDVYTPDRLNEELDISGKTFLNAGGVRMDREENLVLLSRMLKWYGKDFGETEEEILDFIAPYLYREEDREYLKAHKGSASVRYQAYDWRLNRS